MIAVAVQTSTARKRVFRTTLSEEQLLDYFWEASRDRTIRLDVLRELSVVAVRRPDDWDPRAVREAFVARLYPKDGCFSCFQKNRRTWWHHVIAIDHGGSNSERNQVMVCHICHQRIHPWLPEESDLGSWLSVGQIYARIAAGYVGRKQPRRQVTNDDGRGTSQFDTDEHWLYKHGEWE